MTRARIFAGSLGFAVLVSGAAAGLAQNSWPAMHPQPIAIQILDGKRGAPLERVHLQIVAGYDDNDLRFGRWGAEAITDEQGRAMLPDSLKDFGFLAVWVVKHKLCAAHGLSPRLSLGSIRNEGLSTPDECGTLVPVNQPGMLIVFAKAHAKDLRPAPDQRGKVHALATVILPAPPPARSLALLTLPAAHPTVTAPGASTAALQPAVPASHPRVSPATVIPAAATLETPPALTTHNALSTQNSSASTAPSPLPATASKSPVSAAAMKPTAQSAAQPASSPISPTPAKPAAQPAAVPGNVQPQNPVTP